MRAIQPRIHLPPDSPDEPRKITDILKRGLRPTQAMEFRGSPDRNRHSHLIIDRFRSGCHRFPDGERREGFGALENKTREFLWPEQHDKIAGFLRSQEGGRRGLLAWSL